MWASGRTLVNRSMACTVEICINGAGSGFLGEGSQGDNEEADT
jgi:hypothetical protein